MEASHASGRYLVIMDADGSHDPADIGKFYQEIKLRYQTPGFTVKEVPIIFHKRAEGVSKRNLVKFVFSYLKTIERLMKIKRAALRKN